MVKKIDTIVYAGRIKNENILMKSSSGGAFTVISDIFLEHGNAVACSIYNYEKRCTEFKLVTSFEERDKALGSKYMQSKSGNIYQESLEWLKNNSGKNLLFIGMGCQADAFRLFAEIKKIRERVYIVDIICHGVPSPKLWREYISTIEEKHHGKISSLTFKDKRYGWKRPTAFVMIQGKEVSVKEYVKIFYNRCVLRPSCYKCPYTKTKRDIDMTIGDFWHIEETIPSFYSPKGNSLFLIHTEKGLALFDDIKSKMEYCESDITQCWQTHLEKPTQMSGKRTQFWKDYQIKGIKFIVRKYGRFSLMEKIRRKIRESFSETY